jgi:hypothetical protein
MMDGKTDVSPLMGDVARILAELTDVEERILRAKERLISEPDERRYQRLQDQLDSEEPKAEALRRQLTEAQHALAAASHGDTPAQELKKLQEIASTFNVGCGDEARERLRLAIRRVVKKIEVGPKPIGYYFTADNYAIKLGGPGKKIPRYPVLTIILKAGKFIMTGEPPPLSWLEASALKHEAVVASQGGGLGRGVETSEAV